MAYKPEPIDTSSVALTDEINRLIEILAKNAHDIRARDLFARADWKARDLPENLNARISPSEVSRFFYNAIIVNAIID